MGERTGASVESATNETMVRFGYPDTLIRSYAHWAVLLRPDQVTLGSLILVCSEPATAFSEISEEAGGELQGAVRAIERSLSAVWPFRKINYLMLMMVDPHVHFHVIPRYDADQVYEGLTFRDTGWPKLPDLGNAVTPEPAMRDSLVAYLRERWQD